MNCKYLLFFIKEQIIKNEPEEKLFLYKWLKVKMIDLYDKQFIFIISNLFLYFEIHLYEIRMLCYMQSKKEILKIFDF